MVILQKERSENSRSYAVRVLLYNIIHLELQPGTAVSENELSVWLRSCHSAAAIFQKLITIL